MEQQPLVNTALLEQTFSQLEKLKKGSDISDTEKTDAIYTLLGERWEKTFIQRQINIIDALYRILPDRNTKKLIRRVNLLFDGQIESEAKAVLSWIIFGTENAFESGNEDDLLSQQIRLNHGLGKAAAMGDEVEGAQGKFGFDKSNPIPINGIDHINNYFDKLQLVTGESITYKRLRSEKSESLPFLLDVYEIYNLAEEAIAHLYVYAYHGENSSRAPEGFQFLA